MTELPIDEASLERRCLRIIQDVDRGAYSATAAKSDDQVVIVETIAAIGWMYMDLYRAVDELEAIAALQLEDGRIPRARGGDGCASPLLASIARMIYHAARGRQRNLEGRLAQLVPSLDRFHRFIHGRTLRHLAIVSPEDEQALFPPEETAPRAARIDIGWNALLVQADSDLADIAIHTYHPTREIIARRTRTAQAIGEKLFDEERGLYRSRSADGAAWEEGATVAGLLPLWSGAALRQHARRLVEEQIAPHRGFFTAHPLSTLPYADPGYRPSEAGRGAVSPLANWLLIRGLHRYGFEHEARTLNDCLLRLAVEHGIWERYSSKDGEGGGLEHSPATASIVLDLIKTPFTLDRW
jgi:hypothetical protein